MNYDLVSKMTEHMNYIKLLLILGNLAIFTYGRREDGKILRGQCNLNQRMSRIFGGHEATPRMYTMSYHFRSLFMLVMVIHIFLFFIDSWPWLVSMQEWYNPNAPITLP